MSRRPLRQFYGHDRQFVLDGVAPPAAPFRRHRARFLEALASLSPDEWAATTRCDAWNAKDVAHHLVSADDFFALTLQGRGHTEPTTYLRGFDPSSSPPAFIAPKRDHSPEQALEELTTSTENLASALDAIGNDDWARLSESPLGHMPLRAIAAHALWDSWLHERDILLPLGHTPHIEEDELLNATAFTLFIGGTQGGVLADDEAVGDGPDAPIESALAFDDLPGRTLRIRYDRDVVVDAAGAEDESVPVGSALEFVEGFGGRIPVDTVLDRLPADVAGQLLRARQIL